MFNSIRMDFSADCLYLELINSPYMHENVFLYAQKCVFICSKCVFICSKNVCSPERLANKKKASLAQPIHSTPIQIWSLSFVWNRRDRTKRREFAELSPKVGPQWKLCHRKCINPLITLIADNFSSSRSSSNNNLIPIDCFTVFIWLETVFYQFMKCAKQLLLNKIR